jgi:hypothetical protein
MRTSRLFMFVASAMVLTGSGCATLVDGGSQNVTFNSHPNGAKLLHNGVQIGVTPLTADLDRSEDTVILAQKEGYHDQQIQLQTKANAWIWGNIICCGLLGSTTDTASGAAIEYSPNTYYVTLEPKESHQYSKTQDVPLDKDKKVRGYIIRNFDDIAKDLAKGDGEYLSALYTMLDIPEAEYKLMHKKLTVMATENKEAPPFAKAVLEKYGTSAGNVTP